jgi:hypothetical protein
MGGASNIFYRNSISLNERQPGHSGYYPPIVPPVVPPVDFCAENGGVDTALLLLELSKLEVTGA